MHERVTLTEAKTQISSLVTAVGAGTEITITRRGRAIAGIVGALTRTPGDWAWPGSYNKPEFAPPTDQEIRDEFWPG